MGFTEAQVRQAELYSQKHRVDIFEALQQLQNRQKHSPDRRAGNIPAFSALLPMKSVRTADYEVIYSRSGLRENKYARDELREPNVPVGLFNVSNCCYLNSLLQCYFLMGAFTREILSAEEIDNFVEQSGTKIKRVKNEYLLLAALKEIFAKMKMSSRRYLDPTPVLRNLVNSLG